MFQDKVLCLGNNSKDTDLKTSILATKNQTSNHGLINDCLFVPLLPGYYHTTLVDLEPANVVKLSKYFNNIVFLDQPLEEWSHPSLFSATFKLIIELKELGCTINFQNPEVTKNIEFFNNVLENNKSFCIYPFMHLISPGNGYTSVCSRSQTPITKVTEIGNWHSNVEYQKIRNNMINGIKMPEHCSYCYELESNGGKGVRFFDSIEWVTKLNLSSFDDLKNIKSPAYYEIRPSNKCNIQCRTCMPQNSHLIETEFKKIGITDFPPVFQSYTNFEIVDINNVQRLYVAGGEPTIMPELYDFMRKCIANNQTNFEFMINTNAVKLNDTLLELFSHFPNLGFSCSLDGVGLVNDYIRWPTNFDTAIKNMLVLRDRGHRISFISVVSIYNITNLNLLLEFQDKIFPGSAVMLQFDSFVDDIQSPFNHPSANLVTVSLEKCKLTNVYHNYSRGTKSIIDTLYDHYQNNPVCDITKLKKFFEFNDKLDQSRNHKLADYIPELERAREYIKFIEE